MDFKLVQRLRQPADTNIVLVVIGGLPRGLGKPIETASHLFCSLFPIQPNKKRRKTHG